MSRLITALLFLIAGLAALFPLAGKELFGFTNRLQADGGDRTAGRNVAVPQLDASLPTATVTVAPGTVSPTPRVTAVYTVQPTASQPTASPTVTATVIQPSPGTTTVVTPTATATATVVSAQPAPAPAPAPAARQPIRGMW